MNQVKTHFIYSPGVENDQGRSTVNSTQQTTTPTASTAPKEKKKDNRSWFRRMRDALQDWSNGDQRQQEYDDTRV